MAVVISRFAAPLILISSLLGCGEQVDGPASIKSTDSNTLSVLTVELQPVLHVPQIITTGTIQAVDEVVLSVDVSAPISAIHAREGQQLVRGELLLELDDERLLHQLTQAEQALRQVESRAEEAANNLLRREELAELETLSQEILENAKHEAERTVAAVEEARAAVSLAARNLRESRVTSPVEGVLDQRFVDIGETVQRGQALLSIQATGNLEVMTYVSERDIHLVSMGASAIVRLANWPEHPYQATVTTAGIAADSRTGNFPVKLLLANADGRLRPGMAAQVTLEGIEEPVLLLPDEALVDYQRGQAVFVVRDGRAELRRPQLGVGLGEHIRVLGGLDAGDHVIVSNLTRVRDGLSVEPRSQKAS